MNWFWPIETGKTLIDVWTIPHLSFWIVVGSVFHPLNISKRTAFWSSMAVAFMWEIFEQYAFREWPQTWEDPESWINSWISDPFTCVVGFLGMWYLLDVCVGRKTRGSKNIIHKIPKDSV